MVVGRPDARIECSGMLIKVGNRPNVFVRFYPDTYEGKTCFTQTKTGTMSLNQKV